MAKKETVPKPRAEKYDPKVKFEGTLEQMIKMGVNTMPNQSDKKSDK